MSHQENALFDTQGFNAVIAGNGAIGSAILDNLLQRPNLGRIAVLQRGEHRGASDPRVLRLHIDALEPDTVLDAAEVVQEAFGAIHFLVNTIGTLHNADHQPEKSLKQLNASGMAHAFSINAMLAPLLAQAFSAAMRHKQPALLASLSARVGSITDNELGGWYSYRASKAAHNMLLRTIAREWRISHRNTTVVALHPGTVQSRLSKPFISPNYKNPVLTPQRSATALLQVISQLDTRHSGSFYDWQGEEIPW